MIRQTENLRQEDSLRLQDRKMPILYETWNDESDESSQLEGAFLLIPK